ncbi:hypothetical protein [Chitinophaga qingshengii]|uniref:Uncharacterized protein n=1 Tax=Chitinophaga qingshengii TaxID=1569794 RepID=A0ABR7TFS8_9BACT|nr:hypothetical protein [Chitinophaga qingshengii]MBC9929179.1 hypothetical protein [Chitinophaga qingshengii]
MNLALYHPVAPSIQTAKEQTAQRTILAREAVAAMKRYFFVDQLNQELADNEEAKDAIATVLCDFAQVSWNTDRDLNSAMQAVTWALALNISVDKRKQVWIYEEQLKDLYKKHVGIDICHFCAAAPHHRKSSIFQPLYLETARSARVVDFKKMKVEVPRCQRCEGFHSKDEGRTGLAFLGTLVLFVVIGYFMHAILIMAALGFGAGWVATKLVGGRIMKDDIVRPATNEVLALHPVLVPWIEDGWTLEKPEP